MSTAPRGIISSVLSSACAAWLRTQVSAVAGLQVKISAGDRQMLAGTIPAVTVAAQQAVYQGLSFANIQLLAEEIAVNLSQVVRGKPLQLLHPLMVNASVTMTEDDLQSSLGSPLFSQALTDLVGQICAGMDSWGQVHWQSIAIQGSQVELHGQLECESRQNPLTILTGIEMIDGHILRLVPLRVSCSLNLPGSDREEYEIDLGDQVNLTELILQDGMLMCSGKIQVNP